MPSTDFELKLFNFQRFHSSLLRLPYANVLYRLKSIQIFYNYMNLNRNMFFNTSLLFEFIFRSVSYFTSFPTCTVYPCHFFIFCCLHLALLFFFISHRIYTLLTLFDLFITLYYSFQHPSV